jgi:hypothetical protein
MLVLSGTELIWRIILVHGLIDLSRKTGQFSERFWENTTMLDGIEVWYREKSSAVSERGDLLVELYSISNDPGERILEATRNNPNCSEEDFNSLVEMILKPQIPRAHTKVEIDYLLSSILAMTPVRMNLYRALHGRQNLDQISTGYLTLSLDEYFDREEDGSSPNWKNVKPQSLMTLLDYRFNDIHHHLVAVELEKWFQRCRPTVGRLPKLARFFREWEWRLEYQPSVSSDHWRQSYYERIDPFDYLKDLEIKDLEQRAILDQQNSRSAYSPIRRPLRPWLKVAIRRWVYSRALPSDGRCEEIIGEVERNDWKLVHHRAGLSGAVHPRINERIYWLLSHMFHFVLLASLIAGGGILYILFTVISYEYPLSLERSSFQLLLLERNQLIGLLSVASVSAISLRSLSRFRKRRKSLHKALKEFHSRSGRKRK